MKHQTKQKEDRGPDEARLARIRQEIEQEFRAGYRNTVVIIVVVVIGILLLGFAMLGAALSQLGGGSFP